MSESEQKDCIDKNNNYNKQENEDHMFRFDPPLYIQRYHYISKLINEFNPKTYLDIGNVF